jgi:hypothetical protein
VPVPDPSGKRDVDGTPTLLGKRIEIHPDEADVVRRIFAWAADGVGRGPLWNASTGKASSALGSGAGRLVPWVGSSRTNATVASKSGDNKSGNASLGPAERSHEWSRVSSGTFTSGPICGSSRMHCGTEFKRCARGNSFVAKQAHQLSPDERCGLYVIGTATQSADPATEVPGEGTHVAAGQIG